MSERFQRSTARTRLILSAVTVVALAAIAVSFYLLATFRCPEGEIVVRTTFGLGCARAP